MAEFAGFKTVTHFGNQLFNQKFCHPTISAVIKSVIRAHGMWETSPITKIEITPEFRTVKKDHVITEQGIKISFKPNGSIQSGPA